MSDIIRPAGGSFEELLQRKLSATNAFPTSAGSLSNAAPNTSSLRNPQSSVNLQKKPSVRFAAGTLNDSVDDDIEASDEEQQEVYRPAPFTSYSSQFQAINDQLSDSNYEPRDDDVDDHFDDGNHDEHHLAPYDEHDEGNSLSSSTTNSSLPASFETSFPLPSLARTHPLSPLKESSQEIDTERLRYINSTDPRDQDSGIHEDDELTTADSDAEGHEEFQTAIYQPSPDLSNIKRAGGSGSANQHPIRKSLDELDEFEQLEEQARREAEQEAAEQQLQQQPKKLRPSTAQMNHSLTRQQMLQLDREQQDASLNYTPYDSPSTISSAQPSSQLFDDHEEWTDPAPAKPVRPSTSSSTASATTTRPSTAGPRVNSGLPASRIPVRSPPRAALREEEPSESEYAETIQFGNYQDEDQQQDEDEEPRYQQRDPLSMAQVIPSYLSRNQNPNSAASTAGNAAPPTSNVVKKFFNTTGGKPGTTRPSTAPGKKPSAATATSTASKSGSNKKKPLTGTSAAAAVGEKTLQGEMDRLQHERERLRVLNKEQEQELQFLKRERSAAMERLQADRDEFERMREEESKKLKSARLQLDKERRSMSGAPDRRDREVIDELKKQLTAAQDELQHCQEKARANELRSRREKEQLQNELRELKKEMAAQEMKRLDEWEARERTFVQQMEVQQKKKERDEKERREREKQLSSGTSQPSATAAAPPYAPSASSSSARSTAASSAHAHDGAANGHPAARFVSNTPAFTAAPPAASTASIHHANPAVAAPPPPTASAAASLAFSLRPPPSHRDLLDRGPAANTLSVVREINHPGGKVERFLTDNSRLILFKNGTTKRIFQDGFILVSFPNGDKKQTEIDGRVIYYYHSADTTHTTYPDGLQLYEFSNQQIEKHYTDGRKQIFFNDGTVKNIQKDGSEETRFADGTIQRNPPPVAAHQYHQQSQSFALPTQLR